MGKVKSLKLGELIDQAELVGHHGDFYLAWVSGKGYRIYRQESDYSFINVGRIKTCLRSFAKKEFKDFCNK